MSTRLQPYSANCHWQSAPQLVTSRQAGQLQKTVAITRIPWRSRHQPHTLAVALGSISAVQETRWTVAHLFDLIFAQLAAVLI